MSTWTAGQASPKPPDRGAAPRAPGRRRLPSAARGVCAGVLCVGAAGLLGACGSGAAVHQAGEVKPLRLPQQGASTATGATGADGAAAGGGAASAGDETGPTSDGAAASVAGQQPLAGKTIAIDPGHDGGNFTHPAEINRLVPAGGFEKACDTTGTETDGGYTEAQFTLDVSLRLARILRSEGAHVVLTRTTNTGVGPCVNERAAIGNRAHANVAISIHGDGFEAWGHGFQVLEPGLRRGYTEAIVEPSARFGRILASAMAQHSGLTPSNYAGRRGIVVRTDLGGLNLSHVPKVFLECGNMKNAHDAALQMSASWRGHLAHVIAGALARYLASEA